jgi:hypothetical protein
MTDTVSAGLRHVGLAAGQSIRRWGTLPDVELFFGCIPYATVAYQGQPWELILDRLYRRYLRPEDLGPAVELMRLLRTWMSGTPSDFVDWKALDPEQSTLDPSAANLSVVFHKFFSYFDEAVDEARYHIGRYGFGGLNTVVRLVVSDMGNFIKFEQDRPLSDYDGLLRSDRPFWSRPYAELEQIKARGVT